MPFSVNIKTDVVDFDAGTNISADTVDELKQNLTDFIQSGVVDLVNRAALAARARGHAAKSGQAPQAQPARAVGSSFGSLVDDLAQAVGNVQQVFPQATQIPEPEQAAVYVQPAPPVPQPSLPAGFEFQQRPDGKLNLHVPYVPGPNFAAVNDTIKQHGGRSEKQPDGSWAKYKVIPADKQEAVARALANVLG